MPWRPPASELGNTFNTMNSATIGRVKIWLDMVEDIDPKVPAHFFVCAEEVGRVILEIYEQDQGVAETTFENARDFIRAETNDGQDPWDFHANPAVERNGLSKAEHLSRTAEEHRRKEAERERKEEERRRAEEADMVAQPDWGRF